MQPSSQRRRLDHQTASYTTSMVDSKILILLSEASPHDFLYRSCVLFIELCQRYDLTHYDGQQVDSLHDILKAVEQVLDKLEDNVLGILREYISRGILTDKVRLENKCLESACQVFFRELISIFSSITIADDYLNSLIDNWKAITKRSIWSLEERYISPSRTAQSVSIQKTISIGHEFKGRFLQDRVSFVRQLFQIDPVKAAFIEKMKAIKRKNEDIYSD